MNVDISSLFSVVVQLFMALCAGYAAYKFGFIDHEFSKKLSNFVVCVATPFMIIGGLLNVEKSFSNLKQGAVIMLLALGIYLVSGIIARAFTLGFKQTDERKIAEFAIMFSNTGYMGFPVMRALFGDIGGFYCSFFLVIFHFVLWTYGIYILSKNRPNIQPKPINMVLNYGTVPAVIGVILYILPFKLPAPIIGGIDMIGSICTPISMFIIGGLLATIPLKKIFTNPKIYYISFIKLIVLPLIVALVVSLTGVEDKYVYFCVAMAAMPSASNTAMYAEKFGIEPVFGAMAPGISTIISLATIPGIIFITKCLLQMF